MPDTPMTAESVTITGHNGDEIEAYFARPTTPGPHPGVVVIHHMPGYDGGTKEITRRFAAHGYAALIADVERGVEGFVCQFSDFGAPETVGRFMRDVVPAVRGAATLKS